MSRSKVREMKRAIIAAVGARPSTEELMAAKACAAALLERSISFGHARLAVLRLSAAAEIDADVPFEHWKYCSAVISTCNDAVLKDLFTQAVHHSSCPAASAFRQSIH